ncbi:MAG TPA: TIGR04282 family arsenosugar biosynthesis glycosyltransferase [Saprospiraceae bacterium]|nr:TIGR04282 family arsenosugar biosynthesis glycosyltransferase [Saprospiraceae bacterium]
MTAEQQNPAMIIFIKNPEKGKVKTRLAASLGDDEALRIYLELCNHTRRTALQVTAARFLFYSDWTPENDDWPAQFFMKKKQTEADLGARMEAAFAEVFQTHAPVLIIGSDCPGLSSDIIGQAFEQLTRSDFVIGPAADGGYYLLGMQNFEPFVFKNMSWSHENVLRDTLQKISVAGKTCFLLPELTDIDTVDDWAKFGGEFLTE